MTDDSPDNEIPVDSVDEIDDEREEYAERVAIDLGPLDEEEQQHVMRMAEAIDHHQRTVIKQYVELEKLTKNLRIMSLLAIGLATLVTIFSLLNGHHFVAGVDVVLGALIVREYFNIDDPEQPFPDEAIDEYTE